MVVPEPLAEEYVDNNYWNLPTKEEEPDYDALLAELEA